MLVDWNFLCCGNCQLCSSEVRFVYEIEVRMRLEATLEDG